MKIVVVYGFLGCGKTTFINYMLKHILVDQSVVIIENESGKESVDGDFLRNQNYNVVDLRAGCVCCTLRSELPSVIKKVEEQISPDVLIIEPSGIASLEDILSIHSLSVDSVITLIDVERFDLLMRLNREFYIQQFRLSPIILLTKTDLVDTTVTERIKDELEIASPMTRIITDYEAMDVSDMQHNLNSCCKSFSAIVMQKNLKPIKFINETFSITRSINKDRAERLFKEMEACDLTPIRCKGIVEVDSQVVKLDFTAGANVTYTILNGSDLKGFSLTFWWREDSIDLNYRETIEQLIDKYLYEQFSSWHI